MSKKSFNFPRELLVALFSLLCTCSWAGPRSYSQAKAIAEKKAAEMGLQVLDGSSQENLAKGRSGVMAEQSPYYVFSNAETKGFVIVSGDDRFPEIVGYSDQGTYNEAQLPDNFKSYMNAYRAMVEAVDKGNVAATRQLKEVESLRSSVTSTAVSPLLGNIAWGQGGPYNDFCPGDDNESCYMYPAGCVATAMAQIMKYYRCPAALQADIPSYTTKTLGLSIAKRSKEDEKYNWDNMLDKYVSGEYTSSQRMEVASLFIDCGFAVKMDYAPSGSSANITPYVLSHYFGYDADLMQDVSRSSFTQAQWNALIDNELAAKRPILYSGQSSTGGHEFICDGSDGNGLYHINWGWNGSLNGYFDLTVLNANYEGASSSTSTDGYNRDCSMIIGIQPDNGVKDEPLAVFAPITLYDYKGKVNLSITSDTRNNASDAFAGEVTYCFGNLSSDDFAGYLALGVKDKDGNIQLVSSSAKVNIPGVTTEGRGSFALCPLDFNYAFPIGNTTIYGVYSKDGKQWDICGNAAHGAFVVTATANKLTRMSSPFTVSVELGEENDKLVSAMENVFNVVITNNLDYEYDGFVDVYSNSTNECPATSTTSLYVTVPAHGTITRKVVVTPTAGSLYFWVKDADYGNQLLVDAKSFTVEHTSTPVLYLISSTSNADDNDLETEKSYQNGCDIIATPRVHDDKVTFTFGIKNTGATATLRYVAGGWCSGYKWPQKSLHMKDIEFPGDGAVTYIQETFTLDEVGENFMYGDIEVWDGGGHNVLSYDKWPVRQYWYVTKKFWFDGYKGRVLVYLTGESSSISSVEVQNGCQVECGKGFISVLSAKVEKLSVHALDGRCVKTFLTEPNVRQTISLPSSVYIIKGKKVVVR